MSTITISNLPKNAEVFYRKSGELSFTRLTKDTELSANDTLVVVKGSVSLMRPGSDVPLVLEPGANWQVTPAAEVEREVGKLNVVIEADADGDQQVGFVSSDTFVVAIGLPASGAALNQAKTIEIMLDGQKVSIPITEAMRAEGVVYAPVTIAAPGAQYGQGYQFDVVLKNASGRVLLEGDAQVTLFEGVAPEVPNITVTILEDNNADDGQLTQEEIAAKQRLSVEIAFDRQAKKGDALFIRTDNGQWEKLRDLTAQDIARGKVIIKRATPEEGDSLEVEARLYLADGGRSNLAGDSATVVTAKPDTPSITITEDADNNAVLNNAELGTQNTISTQITLGDNNQVGDHLLVWQNGPTGVGGWKTVKILTQDDINNKIVDFEVKRLPEGWTLKVKAVVVTSEGDRSDDSALDTALIDTIGPKLTIEAATNPIGNKSVEILFNFNEVAEGFSYEDIAVQGGNLSGLLKISGTQWKADFKVDGSGDIPSIKVANGLFTDLYENLGRGDSLVLDYTGRTPGRSKISIVEDVDDNEVINAAELKDQTTITTKVTLGSNTLANDSLHVFTNGQWNKVKTLTQSDIQKGSVFVEVANPGEGETLIVRSQVVTSAQVKSPVSYLDSALIDTIGPALNIYSFDNIMDMSVGVFFRFDDPPKGFSFSDITVTGGQLSDFRQNTSTEWWGKFKADGTTETPEIKVLDNAFTDKHGNSGVGDTHNYKYILPRQPDAPSVEITRDMDNNGVINEVEMKGYRKISVDITLGANNEVGDSLYVNVNGKQRFVKKLTQDDIDNAVVGKNFDLLDDGETFEITAQVKTYRNYWSPESEADSALIDVHGPNLSITAVEHMFKGDVSKIYFDFDEKIKGFDINDIVVKYGFGEVSNFAQISDSRWSVDFLALKDRGDYAIKVDKGSFTDLYGNLGVGDRADVELNKLGVDFSSAIEQNFSWSLVYGQATKITTYTLGARVIDLPDFELRDIKDSIESVKITHLDGYGGVKIWRGDSKRVWGVNDTEDISRIYTDKGEQKKDIVVRGYSDDADLALANAAEDMVAQIEVTTKDYQTGKTITQSYEFDIGHQIKRTTISSPLVLDLDNDGVETLALADGVNFDINADGSVDKTGWVGKDDALLVRDVNGDGLINDARELFGEETLKADGTEAAEGFEALSELDSNGDGVFDSQDEAFAEVLLWQDSNSDGISQAHELYSLLDMGVASINLKAEQIAENNNGNIAGLRSSWTDTEGNNHTVDDIWFAYQSGAGKKVVLDTTDLLMDDESIPGLVGRGSENTAAISVQQPELKAISCYDLAELQTEQLLVEQPQLDH